MPGSFDASILWCASLVSRSSSRRLALRSSHCGGGVDIPYIKQLGYHCFCCSGRVIACRSAARRPGTLVYAFRQSGIVRVFSRRIDRCTVLEQKMCLFWRRDSHTHGSPAGGNDPLLGDSALRISSFHAPGMASAPVHTSSMCVGETWKCVRRSYCICCIWRCWSLAYSVCGKRFLLSPVAEAVSSRHVRTVAGISSGWEDIRMASSTVGRLNSPRGELSGHILRPLVETRFRTRGAGR